MDDRKTSKLFSIVAIAFFAGVVGSVLTLFASSYVGKNPTPLTATQRSSVEQVSDSAFFANPVAETQSGAHELELLRRELESVQGEFRQAIADASAERSQYAKTLTDVTRKIDLLESERTERQSALEHGGEFLPAGTEALPVESDSSFARSRREQPGSAQTVQSLVAAGLDEQTAGDIQARRDQYQLARLELFDTATREGWIDSEDFSERLTELNEDRVDLRTELGESAYDQYLFESGSSNRVALGSVINGSAAQIAGLQQGDVVISYAGERVFSAGELQAATRAGSRGEYVQVSFDRAGQFLSADVPRGPLGVTLQSSRVSP